MKITLTRAEAPTEDCGKPCTVDSFAEANAVLKTWSIGTPENGHDKCNFMIKDEANNISYSGRYDLKSWRIECPNLKAHVIGYLGYLVDRNESGEVAVRTMQTEIAKKMLKYFKDAA